MARVCNDEQKKLCPALGLFAAIVVAVLGWILLAVYQGRAEAMETAARTTAKVEVLADDITEAQTVYGRIDERLKAMDRRLGRIEEAVLGGGGPRVRSPP